LHHYNHRFCRFIDRDAGKRTVLADRRRVSYRQAFDSRIRKWIVSIALGFALGTGPLYLTELAPPALRGALVNTCTTMVTFGSFLAAVANYGVSKMGLDPKGLQILIGVQLAPPALALATFFFLPERYVIRLI
jgi:MFS family permease